MASSSDTKYLERHGNLWRVTLNVPSDLKAELGTKLKRSLGTDSLSRANQLKWQIVRDLQELIEKTRGAKAGERKALMQEALEVAQMRVGLSEREDMDVVHAITARTYEILGASTLVGGDSERPPVEIYSPEKEVLVAEYRTIASGNALPTRIEYDKYVAHSLKKVKKLKPGTIDEYDRALNIFDRWRARKKVPDDLRAITTRVAKSFAEDLLSFEGELAPPTCAKYLACIRQYWERLVYLEIIPANPWNSVQVVVPETPHAEKEHAFTEDEVRRLLTGPCSLHLRDLMYIGALSGARIDAIVDLKIGHCMDGFFTFKPQKLERSERHVPIHSALKDIMTRRMAGKKSDDWLFPEFPPPQRSGSLKAHSAQAVKAFTRYRRRIGVDEVVPGKRRALINFHSFRRWFITKAERAGNKDTIIAAVVGHKREGITLDKYSEGPELRQARRLIESIKLPPLDQGPVPQPRGMTPRSR